MLNSGRKKDLENDEVRQVGGAKYAHACTHAHSMYACTHTHARMHTHTHTHTLLSLSTHILAAATCLCADYYNYVVVYKSAVMSNITK